MIAFLRESPDQEETPAAVAEVLAEIEDRLVPFFLLARGQAGGPSRAECRWMGRQIAAA